MVDHPYRRPESLRLTERDVEVANVRVDRQNTPGEILSRTPGKRRADSVAIRIETRRATPGFGFQRADSNSVEELTIRRVSQGM